MYKIIANGILRIEDNALIPLSEDNSDYKNYLVWIEQGNIPEPQFVIEDLKLNKWNEFKQLREDKTAAGFTSGGVVFDSDPVSIARVGNSVQIATICKAGNIPFSVEWTLKDNSTKTLDADAMILAGLDLMAFAQAIFAKGVDYRLQINAATTQSQLDAIIWED